MLVEPDVEIAIRTSENRTFFRPDRKTGRPVFGHPLYLLFQLSSYPKFTLSIFCDILITVAATV